MKRLIIIALLSIGITVAYSQTFHTIIMVNKEEPNRQVDRTADYNNMSSFFTKIAQSLGYKNNMLRYSGQTFRATNALQAIESLNVGLNDIVVFYYSGHGANWDDDEWPHMAFLDRQYGETTIYNKLREKFGNAKLILCISDCCNMDSEGARREKRTYSGFDPALTKKLFTDFEGHRSYEISASIRGQYSYSNRQYGALFGIALREAVSSALTGKTQANWVYVLEKAKSLTLELTNQEQMPQFKMNRW